MSAIALSEPAKSIELLGFRRWYERQLIESHAYLVTSLLCLIAALACVEEFSVDGPGLRPILMLVLITVGLLMGIFACRRYLVTLAYAEHIADSSKCKRCGAYAAYTVLNCQQFDRSLTDAVGLPRLAWFSVKCRKCGQHWTIH